ncbi:MAG: hypothetical protein IT207_06280 [Fimbriimonadaceae bacterium]|nr:hypothetical protein [Fimbriimonadaceae bacterium]
MPLRVLTTALVVFGLGLVLGLPFLLRGPGEDAQPAELKAHAVRLVSVVMLTVIVWVAVALGAILIVARERHDLAKREREMLKELVEASLEDHAADE